MIMTSLAERGPLHAVAMPSPFFYYLHLDLLTRSIDHYAGCVLRPVYNIQTFPFFHDRSI
jgi:hypothetical protein